MMQSFYLPQGGSIRGSIRESIRGYVRWAVGRSVGRFFDWSVGWSIGPSISKSFWSDLASYRLFLGRILVHLFAKIRKN